MFSNYQDVQNKNKIVSFLSPFYFNNSITGAIIFAILLLGKAFIVGALFFIDGHKAQAGSPITAENLVTRTNIERERARLYPLTVNRDLIRAAEKKTRDMIAYGYFSHTTPGGKPFYLWIQEEKYQYKSAGENLAISFISEEDVMNAWMKSVTHRENLLDKNYSEIGIAVLAGEFEGKETIVIAQLFGEPKEANAAFAYTRSARRKFNQEPAFVQGLRVLNTGTNIAFFVLAVITASWFIQLNERSSGHRIRNRKFHDV